MPIVIEKASTHKFKNIKLGVYVHFYIFKVLAHIIKYFIQTQFIKMEYFLIKDHK